MPSSVSLNAVVRLRLRDPQDAGVAGTQLRRPRVRLYLPWEGARAISGPVGVEGGGWEAVDPEPKACSEDGEEEEEETCLHFRWQEAFPDLSWHDEQRRSFNQMPYAFLLLGESPAPEQQTSEAEEGEEEEDASRPLENFCGHVHVDLSPLLAGASCVMAHFAGADGAYARDGGHGQSQSFAVPHEGLSELEIAIFTSDAKPVLDEAELWSSNPLALSFRGAEDLPGLIVEAKRLQKYVCGSDANAHTSQRKFCRPMYAIAKLPEAFTPDSKTGPRLLVSNGILAAEDAKWEQTTVFQSGGVDQKLLEQWMAQGSLHVELHDRDPFDKPGDLPFGRARFEHAFRGTPQEVPVGNVDINLEQQIAQQSKADSDAVRSLEEPLEGDELLMKVDEVLYVPELLRRWTFAGDDNAHGYAHVRLEKLLDQSAQLIEAFARNWAEVRGTVSPAGVKAPINEGFPTEDAESVLSAKDAAAEEPPEVPRKKSAKVDGKDKGKDNAKENGKGQGKGKGKAKEKAIDVGDDSSIRSNDVLGSAYAHLPGDPRLQMRVPIECRLTSTSILTFSGPQERSRMSLAPSKRRRTPKTGVATHNLNEEELLVRQPGRYYESDAGLHVSVALFRPQRLLSQGAATSDFSRAVFMFHYDDAILLQKVLSAVDDLNTQAIGEAELFKRGSLSTMSFTKEEVERVNGGDLDVLCGFEILDDDCRMIVLEGVGDGTVARLAKALPRYAPNNPDYKVLLNPDVRFRERLYTPLNLRLKKVRLRQPLPLLADMPDLYNSSKTASKCALAIVQLAELRRADTLREAALLDLFPSCADLADVESLYGESVSLRDIHGFLPPGKQEHVDASDVIFETPSEDAQKILPLVDTARDKRKPVAARQRLATLPLDARNPDYDRLRKSYVAPDFLRQRRREMLFIRAERQRLLAQQKTESASEPSEPVFTYSVQRCNYKWKQMQELRQRVGKAKNATYTYSMDYQSQGVSLVDNSEVKAFSRDQDPAKWRTKRGFLYPAPKERKDYIVHPHRPSDARIEALHEPWVENELHPRPIARAATPPKEAPKNRPEFDSTPCAPQIFGGYEVPHFKREYKSKDLGNRRRLPRGRLNLTKNPKFFTSVHLVGDELLKEMESLKRAEIEKWRSKVLVDDLHFHVGGYSVRDRPIQVDRRQDILHGKVVKKAFRIIRNAKLPSGKRVPLRQAPYSIFAGEEYKDPREFTLDLRPDDASHFFATDPTSGAKVPFVTRIHADLLKPKSQTIQSKRSIMPLSEAEKTGSKWGTVR